VSKNYQFETSQKNRVSFAKGTSSIFNSNSAVKKVMKIVP